MKIFKLLLLPCILCLPGFLFAQSKETRKLAPFNTLKAAASFETIIQKGTEESAVVEAEGVDIKKVITEVDGQTLRVSLDRGRYRNFRVTVRITYKSLESVMQSGSGKLTCKSDLEADELEVKSSGSGGLDVNGKVSGKKVEIGVSGSGPVKLDAVEADDLQLSASGSGGLSIAEGKVKNEVIGLTGSGGVRIFGVSAENSTVSLSGSGSVEISVTTALSGKIAGSGSIHYKGNAGIVNSAISGSGRINKS